MKITMSLAFLAGLGTAPAFAGATLTTIATFTGANGRGPVAGVTADAAGNLYGTTANGSTVFEIPNTGGTYGTLTTVATLSGTNGTTPIGGVTIDAAGNLLGTAYGGGQGNNGAVGTQGNRVNERVTNG